MMGGHKFAFQLRTGDRVWINSHTHTLLRDAEECGRGTVALYVRDEVTGKEWCSGSQSLNGLLLVSACAPAMSY